MELFSNISYMHIHFICNVFQPMDRNKQHLLSRMCWDQYPDLLIEGRDGAILIRMYIRSYNSDIWDLFIGRFGYNLLWKQVCIRYLLSIKHMPRTRSGNAKLYIICLSTTYMQLKSFLENLGVNPSTSCMQSRRSTI